MSTDSGFDSREYFFASLTRLLTDRWEKFKRLRSSGRTLPGRAGGKKPSGRTGFPRPARPRWVPAPSRYVAALNFSHLHQQFLLLGLAGEVGRVRWIHWDVFLSERCKIFGVPLLAKGARPKGRFLLFEAEGRVQKSSDRAVEGSKIL